MSEIGVGLAIAIGVALIFWLGVFIGKWIYEPGGPESPPPNIPDSADYKRSA